MIRFSLIIIFILSASFVYTQDNSVFKDYQTVRSKGNIPSLFTQPIEETFQSNISNSIISDEKVKDEFTQFSSIILSNFITSGDVLFGDPMTDFVQRVGNRLLAHSPEKNIQFFVLKSTITNALAMEPGVIFVTTGLLAQIENEAQLAFILSHEISHCTLKHSQKSFVQRKDDVLQSNLSVLDLAKLSKDDEIEADTKGIQLYHDAGYSKDKIDHTFLVLMYSYLPFDELPIDSTFFGDNLNYYPNSYFPESPNPIVAFENYDDHLSTHPNIKTRKEEIGKSIALFSNWKENTHYDSEEAFHYVRNLARFETVRRHLLNGAFIQSLYEIYVLEKEFKNNIYLAQLKAIAWNELNKIYLNNQKRSYLKNTHKSEGAMSSLYAFFNRLNKEEMALLSTRMIYNIHLQFPEHKGIQKLVNETIKTLPHLRKIDINTMEKISFYEALKLREEENSSKEDDDISEGDSKYSRISQIQQQNSSSQSVRPLVDENFSYYLMHDIIQDSSFQAIYATEKERLLNGNVVISQDEPKRKKGETPNDYILVYSSVLAKNSEELSPFQTRKFMTILEKQLVYTFKKKDNIKDMRFHLGTEFTIEEYNLLAKAQDFLTFNQVMADRHFSTFYPDQKEIDEIAKGYHNPSFLFLTGLGEIRTKGIQGTLNVRPLDSGKNGILKNTIINGKISNGTVYEMIYRLLYNLN